MVFAVSTATGVGALTHPAVFIGAGTLFGFFGGLTLFLIAVIAGLGLLILLLLLKHTLPGGHHLGGPGLPLGTLLFGLLPVQDLIEPLIEQLLLNDGAAGRM